MTDPAPPEPSAASPKKSRTKDGPPEGKPITITLAADLQKRLKIIAVMKGISVSSLVEQAVDVLVRRDLKKILETLG